MNREESRVYLVLVNLLYVIVINYVDKSCSFEKYGSSNRLLKKEGFC